MIEERVISIHFPKAGGTSLHTQFSTHLPGQVEIDYDHDPLTPRGQETAEFPAGKRLVHGHFRPHRHADAKAFRLTFLRDPVENLISIYFFWQHLTQPRNPVHAKFLAEQPDVLSFAADPIFARLMSQTYFGGFDMRRFDFIGFHETRTADVPRLGHLLDVPLKADIHENPTPSSERRQELQENDAIRRRLRDVLVEDVVFFERMSRTAT